jgi:hypothetical protein
MLDLMQEEEVAVYEAELAARRETETRASVRRLMVALLLSAVILLVFNSERLVTLVNGFEVGPVQDVVVTCVTAWNELMVDTGLTAPSHAVREDVNQLRQTDWVQIRRWIERERARTQEGARLLRGAVGDARG